MRQRSAYLWAVVVLATGCHGDSGSNPIVQSTPHVGGQPPAKRGPTPEELTAGMVEAVTTGTSNVPVAVKFALPQAPKVGEPAAVTIAVMPQIEADPATLVVTGSDALVLAPGAVPVVIPTVDPTQVYRHDVKLTPSADGVQLLGVSVTLKHDDVTETRAFAVPLIVAPAAAVAASVKP